MDMRRLKAAGHDPLGTAETRDISKPFESFPAETIGYLGTEQSDGGAVHVFDATPAREDDMVRNLSTPQMSVDKMLFRIQAETGLPSRITMLAADGSVIMEQTYSNVRVNIGINDSEFEFSPPKDVRVEDMTDGALNMMDHTD
jgi:outer membrane lipoprotein-sorting protein